MAKKLHGVMEEGGGYNIYLMRVCWNVMAGVNQVPYGSDDFVEMTRMNCHT